MTFEVKLYLIKNMLLYNVSINLQGKGYTRKGYFQINKLPYVTFKSNIII